LPPSTNAPKVPLATRAITRRPDVILVSPKKAVRSPFNFLLKFEAHGGSTIRPDSFRLIYLKNPIVDITARVRPYVTANGLEMPDAKTPAGQHMIEAKVSDNDGRESSGVFVLNAFSAARQRSADAIVLLSSPLISANVQVLSELAIRHRLSAITLFPDFARAGGLLAYGPNLLALYRCTGVLAGKVPGGVKAGELPIERPTKFELVLNLKTATALNLAVSASLLLRADEVIE
jgi:hypothetical protein